jgi:hypothetical protein
MRGFVDVVLLCHYEPQARHENPARVPRAGYREPSCTAWGDGWRGSVRETHGARQRFLTEHPARTARRHALLEVTRPARGQALAPKRRGHACCFHRCPGNGFGNDCSNSATDDRRITEAEFVLVVAWWTVVSPGRTIVGRRTIVSRGTIVRRRAVVSSGWTI